MNTNDEKKWRDELFIKTGEYLKEKRVAMDLSLREVGELVRCKAQFICNIERGKAFPPPLVMRGMISAYKINQDEFMEFLMDAQMKFYKGLYFAKKRRKSS